MTWTFKGMGKDKELAKDLLAIELNAKKIKHYPSYSTHALRIDDTNVNRVKAILRKIKSPRPLKFEVSNY